MTLVRERRHQQALRLSLPPPVPAADFRRRSPLPSPLSSTSSNSPGITNLFELEKLAVLGHGNGGTVYKVRHTSTSSIYALKVLRLDEDAVAVRQQAAREAEILKRVDSEFIVKCHAVFDNGLADADCAGSELCFVIEYMEGGSLDDLLRRRRKLPEEAISGLATRVLKGLNYLHEMQIVHGDIKPSNLLINGEGEVKIADFGVSRFVEGKFESSESFMGTSAYMSPERFDPEMWNEDFSDGFAGDVWSLGVVSAECHVGHFPLIAPGQKPDWATLMCAICFGERMEIPETMSPEFQSFVGRCLEKDWRRRGTVEELLSHPFVTSCHSPQELEG
ncbi:mitogen-activated protein kinase kinase 10 [Diospyros lotus]|uniref:mitogen-activated protein kinase kinase 10 n=1 Tax=Diospyros lotus TaxID=55363 RepID=UPI002252FD7B|nr:mitogen-activated protein kinase kinase 10 [Diospyros lotus]